MKKVIITLVGILIILLSTGCGKKCLESHQEQSQCVSYTHIKIGNSYMSIPHYYSCVRTVCDKYEVE